MKKISFLLVLILFSSSVYAVLGPKFDEDKRPHSICAIEFFSPHNLDVVDEICSVVIVDQSWGLTAGHCVTKLPDRPHRVFCRDQITTTIDEVFVNPDLKMEELRFVELAHQFDSALVRFNHPIAIPALPFVRTLIERQELIKNARICGIFGHGGFRTELRNSGYSTQAMINPTQIELEENLIRIKGIGGINSGLVEPGDSGGSLSCQKVNGQWVHLAQVSGRKHNYVSFLAPTDLLNAHLSNETDFNVVPNIELEQRWRDEDLKRDLVACERNYNRLMGFPFERTTTLDLAKTECENILLNEAIARLEAGEKVVARLKPYALVNLTQTEQAVRSQNNYHNRRYLEHSNPFSITDHAYTQLTITRFDLLNGTATGTLRAFGGPEYFACLENVICDTGEFDLVTVDLKYIYFDRR